MNERLSVKSDDIRVTASDAVHGVRPVASGLDEATARPWKVTDSGGIAGDGEAIIINGRSSRHTCDAVNDGFGKAKANAAFIVRAVNEHSALLEVEKVLTRVIGRGVLRYGQCTEDDILTAEAQEALDKVAAIRKEAA